MRSQSYQVCYSSKAVVEGDEKDPVIELLDKVLGKTRVAANQAVDAFQKQFKEALVPCVPAEHLLVLGSNAYNTVSQFHMAIWRMVADECIMPMWHDYLTNFSLASVMQHALEKVLSTCMRIMPPHPPEPKDDSLSRLVGKCLSIPCTSDTRCASYSGTSSYARGSASSHRSSTRDSCFGRRASAHDYCSSVRGECLLLLYLPAWRQVCPSFKLPLVHLLASKCCQ